jgi:hypothetical protein
MPRKNSRKNNTGSTGPQITGSTGPQITGSPQGEAASAGGNYESVASNASGGNDSTAAVSSSGETANQLPMGSELSQAASAGENHESGTLVVSDGNDSPAGDDWMNSDGSIVVPSDNEPRTFCRSGAGGQSDDCDIGPNFKGTPVEVQESSASCLMNPEFLSKINEILLRNSEILIDLGPFQGPKSGTKTGVKPSVSSKYLFDGETTVFIKVVLKHLDINGVSDHQLEGLSKLFSPTIKFVELLAILQSVQPTPLADKTLSLNYLMTNMSSVKKPEDRLKPLVGIVVSYFDQQLKQCPNEIWSFDRLLVDLIDAFNKGHLWKQDDVEKRGGSSKSSVVGGFIVSKMKHSVVSTSELTGKELNEIAIGILKNTLDTHAKRADCKSLLLLVCAIFRRISRMPSGDSFKDSLFWELLLVCEKIGTTDTIPILCFDLERDFLKMKEKVLDGSSAKLAHLSRTCTSTQNLMNAKDLLNLLMIYRLLVDVSNTGTGKTTNWFIAFMIRALMLSMSESKGDRKSETGSKGGVSVVYVGPLNRASDLLIRVICHALQEYLDTHGFDIKLVPVDNGIVPKGSTKDNTGRIVYVFMSNTLDILPTISTRFCANHRFLVMIDDHPIDNLNCVLGNLRNNESFLNVIACGASIDISTIDESLGATIRGCDTPSLSSISSHESICHDVPLTLEQMKTVRGLVLSGLQFYAENIDNLRLLLPILLRVEFIGNMRSFGFFIKTFGFFNKKLFSGENSRVYNFLHNMFPLEVDGSIKHVGESDEDFERRFLRHFLKLTFLLLLKTLFDLRTVEREYSVFLSSDNCDVFQTTGRLAVIFERYFHALGNDLGLKFLYKNSGWLPELPAGIIDVSHMSSISRVYHNVFYLIKKAGFFLPEPLDFPKPVPMITDKCFMSMIKKSHGSSCFFMCGAGSNPMTFANGIVDAMVEIYGKVKTQEEEKEDQRNHDRRRRGTQAGSGSNSRGFGGSCNRAGNGSTVTTPSGDNQRNPDPSTHCGSELDPEPNESSSVNDDDVHDPDSQQPDNIDMTASVDQQIHELCKAAKEESNKFSSTAPLPSETDCKTFAECLVTMQSPVSRQLIRLFASGVFIPMQEMSYETITLAISLLVQGRLRFIVQDGKGQWDMRSQNFAFSLQVFFFFLSEVSWDFFFQNCLGRGGRQGHKSRGLVICRTPSGRIVYDALKQPVVKAEPVLELCCSHLDADLVFKILEFMYNCSSLSPSHNVFINDFVKLFSEVLYNPVFKFSVYSKNYDRIFQFLSCYLSSRFCGLEVSGTIDGSLDEFLMALAINEKSRKDFLFLKDEEKRKKVEDFVNRVSEVLNPTSVHVAASLCCAIKDRVFPGFNCSILVTMYFKIKELRNFIESLTAFLTNLYSSGFKSKNGNEEIRPMVTFLNCIGQTIAGLISLIASRVKEREFLNALAERRLGCLQNADQVSPIESLKQNLLESPRTIQDFLSCLQHAASGDRSCAIFLLEFNRRCLSFGPKAPMVFLRENQVSRLCDLETKMEMSMTTIRETLSNLDRCDSEVQLNVEAAEKALKAAMKPPIIPARITDASTNLKNAKKKVEEVKAQNDASRLKCKEEIEALERTRLDIMSQIAECESSLRKYDQMSESDFLKCFLSEMFD